MQPIEHECKVTRIVDGDTVDVVVFMSFGISFQTRIRLYGIDTPESRTRDKSEKVRGLAATARLDQILKEHSYKCVIKFNGDGKFGRPLGEIFVNGVNVNQTLVKEGHAKSYFGGKK